MKGAVEFLLALKRLIEWHICLPSDLLGVRMPLILVVEQVVVLDDRERFVCFRGIAFFAVPMPRAAGVLVSVQVDGRNLLLRGKKIRELLIKGMPAAFSMVAAR